MIKLENLISTNIVCHFLANHPKEITILAYHNIASQKDVNYLQDNSVTIDEFERQIQFLREESYNIIPLKTLMTNLVNGIPIKNKTVIITFDDGYKTTFYNAFPILKKYKIQATVFIAVGYIGDNTSFEWLAPTNKTGYYEDLSPMNWEEIIELHKSGIEIGSHTLSHTFLPYQKKEKIEYEISQAQTIIKDKIGIRPYTFALPFSFPLTHWKWPSFKSVISHILKKENYLCCCTVLRGHINKNTIPFFLKRIVIGKYDTIESFCAKLIGAYDWSRVPQLIFQSLAKTYKI